MMRTKEQNRKYMREWYHRNKAKNPDKVRREVREKNLRRKFGIGIIDYDAMFVAQKGRCAICNTPNPGGNGSFHVDHNHNTGQIRGLLCWLCNTGLGQFQDDPKRLRVAARYLGRK